MNKEKILKWEENDLFYYNNTVYPTMLRWSEEKVYYTICFLDFVVLVRPTAPSERETFGRLQWINRFPRAGFAKRAYVSRCGYREAACSPMMPDGGLPYVAMVLEQMDREEDPFSLMGRVLFARASATAPLLDEIGEEGAIVPRAPPKPKEKDGKKSSAEKKEEKEVPGVDLLNFDASAVVTSICWTTPLFFAAGNFGVRGYQWMVLDGRLSFNLAYEHETDERPTTLCCAENRLVVGYADGTLELLDVSVPDEWRSLGMIAVPGLEPSSSHDFSSMVLHVHSPVEVRVCFASLKT